MYENVVLVVLLLFNVVVFLFYTTFVIWVWLLPNYCFLQYRFGLYQSTYLFFYLHNVGHDAFNIFAQDADAALI